MQSECSTIKNRNHQDIAYVSTPAPGRSDTPGVIFLGGFRSDMTGTKAVFLEQQCRAAQIPFLRFDYSGHGASQGNFADGTIGQWVDDAMMCLDALTTGPQILVGSSMGGWIMLHLALRRPERIAGLMGIAAAPDFTEDLMWAQMTPAQQQALMQEGHIEQPNHYSPEPYLITRRLIEDGRQHLLLRDRMNINCPVCLVHGTADQDVPYQLSLTLADKLTSDDVQISLIKNGDHRISTGRDVRHLWLMLNDVVHRAGPASAMP